MRKIPTLFVRDPDTNLKRVKNEVNPGCEWVLAGEGVATRKYDGTCVMFDGIAWWVRREVKPGKAAPPNFEPIETDGNTGKTVGWEPAEQSGFAKYLVEAVELGPVETLSWTEGTYELVGPKIQGNPEDYTHHSLVRHGLIETPKAPRTFDELRDYLLMHTFEGVVWHHPDGRMAKLKRRDFPALVDAS